MKKFIIFLTAALATSVCMAGMMDSVVLTKENITTSTSPTVVRGSANGIVKAINVEVFTADANVDLDVYGWQSNVLFTIDDATVGNTLYTPSTYGSLIDGVVDTNKFFYIQPANGGEISAYFGDADNATSKVSITILYEKR